MTTQRRRNPGPNTNQQLRLPGGPQAARATTLDRGRQLLAVLLTAAAVVLLPALLVAMVGWPLPTSVPTVDEMSGWVTNPLSSDAVVDVLAVVFWVAWAHFVACLVVEFVNTTVRRGRPAWHVPGGGLSQEWARRLVTAVLLVGATAPLAAVASPGQAPSDSASPTRVTSTQAVASTTGSLPTENTPAANGGLDLGVDGAGDAAAATTTATGAVDQAEDLRRYVVAGPEAGYSENLWDIAERHLGDGLRWSQIHALNVGLAQPDGEVLDDPDLIRPGWHLRMPADATDLPPWVQTPAASTPATGGQPPVPAGVAGATPQEQSEAVHVVEPGESLWRIAQDRLGDGARHDELAAASSGLVQPDGEQLVDPDLIRPGWVIPVPVADTATSAGATGPAPVAPVVPPPPADEVAPEAPSSPVSPRAFEGPNRSIVVRGQVETGASVHDASAADGRGVDTDGAGQVGSGEVEAGGDEAGEADMPWMLSGLTGAGAVLAGALWLTLRQRRRAQFRARRPGWAIASVPPELAAVERSIMVSGGKAAPTVQTLDVLLRRLARDMSDHGAAGLPALAAVELAGTQVVLHLGAPMKLPGGWQGTEDDLHWTHTGDVTGAAVELEGLVEQPAPYPLLVTVGADDDGDVWLLNLEHLGAVAITGDPGMGRDFARHLIAELALQDWSRGLLVDCIGLAGELVPINPDVLRFHPADAADAAISEAVAAAVALVDRSDAHGVDPVRGRGGQVGDDTWPSRLVLADLDAVQRPPSGPLADLLELMRARPGRTGTGVLLTCGAAEGQVPGVRVDIDAKGRLRMPASGLDLVAVGLPEDEAAGCAQVAAVADDLDGAPMPVGAHEDSEEGEGDERDWHRFTDAAGALRPELTLPREGDAHRAAGGARVVAVMTEDWTLPNQPHHVDDAAPTSLLEGADEEYLACSATTAQDLQALAPRVAVDVRQAVEDADPTLDADVARWWAQDCDLPRLTLLGSVRVRTRGIPLAKRKPYYTDLLAYLWSRPHGATPAEVADAFGITVPRVRTDIKVLRDWLGTNPRTSKRHLPDANQSAAGIARGVGVYQVEDLLVDADLFRRLRVRGQARGGAAGLADLRAAIELVTGRPCDDQRPGGWSWMLEGDRLDQHLLFAVVDVAHTVTTQCLRDGDLDGARAAAELSVAAAPEEEIARLDLAAVARADGDARAARQIALDEVCNRSDDGQAPTELSDRTQQILARHDWLHADTTAG